MKNKNFKRSNIEKLMVAIIRLESKNGLLIFDDELKKESKLNSKDFNDCLDVLKKNFAILEHPNGIIQRF
ncbi:MAG: hypothetical protein WCP89_04245 [archaeon]